MITKIINDELTQLLGGDRQELKINASGITTILVVGLQGSGKTTFSAKLAKRLKENGRKTLLVAADVYRPAAIEQLKLSGNQADIKVFSIEEPDAVKVVKESLIYAKDYNVDTVIIDTAGRLHVDEDMMKEVSTIKKLLDRIVEKSMLHLDKIASGR